MGKILLMLVVFTAGYLWGDIALALVIDVWRDLDDTAWAKFTMD